MVPVEIAPQDVPLPTPAQLTRHARRRVEARGFSQEAVHAALTYGRIVHARGARIHVIGRKEVTRCQRRGLDLRPHEGVQVVCSPGGGLVLTVYRNRDFRGLRPQRRGRV